MKLDWMGEYRGVVEALIHYCNIYAGVYRVEKLEFEGVTYSYAQIQVLEYLLENEELHFPAGTRGGFSVFALEKEGCSLTIRGMYYEAQNLPLCNDYPIGVSNSFLPEKVSCVRVQGTPALAVIRYEQQDPV